MGATSPRACATTSARCSASPACYVARRLGDAGPGRRQPVADHRRLRRPRERPDDGDPAAFGAAARGGGHHVARADRRRRASPRPHHRRDQPVVHRGDEGLRRARRRRPGARRRARPPARPAADVPPHDHRRRRRPLRRRPGSTSGRATGYVECDLFGGRQHGRSAAWFNLFTQDGDPSRRTMLLPAALRRRRRQPADARRAQGRPRRPRRSTSGRTRPPSTPASSPGHVDRRATTGPSSPPACITIHVAGLRCAAHDVPHRGTGPGARDGGVRPALPRPALGGLRTVAGGEPG